MRWRRAVSSPKHDLRDLAARFAGKARSDEIALEKLADDPDVPDDLIGFHAQQALEKLLKAALAHAGVAPPRIHDLGELVARLTDAAAGRVTFGQRSLPAAQTLPNRHQSNRIRAIYRPPESPQAQVIRALRVQTACGLIRKRSQVRILDLPSLANPSLCSANRVRRSPCRSVTRGSGLRSLSGSGSAGNRLCRTPRSHESWSRARPMVCLRFRRIQPSRLRILG